MKRSIPVSPSRRAKAHMRKISVPQVTPANMETIEPSLLPSPVKTFAFDISDHEHDQQISEEGFCVERLQSHDRKGRTVGTLRVLHMNEKSMQEAFPTWATKVNRYAKLTYENRPSDDRIWELAVQSNLVVDTADREHAMRELFEKSYLERWQEELVAHHDATVVYSEVHPKHQKKGVGVWMYLTMAQHLGTQGKRLREHQTRSPSAEKLWNKLERDGWCTRETYLFPGHQNPSTFRTLDFR